MGIIPRDGIKYFYQIKHKFKLDTTIKLHLFPFFSKIASIQTIAPSIVYYWSLLNPGRESGCARQMISALNEPNETGEDVEMITNEVAEMEAIISEAISQSINTESINTEDNIENITSTTEAPIEQVESEDNIVMESVQLVVEETPLVLAEAKVAENDTDGPRAKHLKQALRKALNNTIKSCRYEEGKMSNFI